MTDQSHSREKKVRCQPLRSLDEIHAFVLDPPAWRSLCQPLTPHGSQLIKNMDIVQATEEEISLEKPISFCHFDIDQDKNQLIRYDEGTLPKTLVCHDMANGYHDDACVDGSKESNNYVFYNWAGIDIFCYFSHNLLTVPPLSWINVAHAHGVKVIGTLITEWADGSLFWEKVLGSPEESQYLISCLVTIAKTLKFEGWLLNIENKISKPAQLLEFVRALHAALHEEVPSALLIWYDSVTENGQLSWQNKLNESNRVFFDACDGIFTNYSWSEQDVSDSVAAAGARRHDVFVGVDVWGRNFFGGGMFNTQEAVRLIHGYACSLAIFAPAWTFEVLSDAVSDSDPNVVLHGDALSRYDRFLLRDRALWGSLWPFLNTRVPCVLPFKTSFCRGRGMKRWMYGEVISSTPWYNLRHMQYQPNSAHGPHRYLLSTTERIHAASRIARKDNEIIIKLRESLYTLKKCLIKQKHKILSSDSVPSTSNQVTTLLPSSSISTSNSNRSLLHNGRTGSFHRKQNIISKISVKSKCNNKISKYKNSLKSIFDVSGKDVVQPPGMDEESAVSVCVDLGYTSESRNSSSVSRLLEQVQEQTTLQSRREKKHLKLAYVAEERECLEEYEDDAFVGGSCLAIHPSDAISENHRTVRLLHCDFTVDHSLVVCLATKPVADFSSQYLTLVLLGFDDSGPQRFVLTGQKLDVVDVSAVSTEVSPLAPGSPAYRALQAHLLSDVPDFYVPVANNYGWTIFYYEVVWPGLRLTSINARTGKSQGAILLGHLGVSSRRAPDVSSLDNNDLPRDNLDSTVT